MGKNNTHIDEKQDDLIALPDSYSNYNNLKMVLNKQGYDISKGENYEVGGVVKTAHGITNDAKKGGYFDGRSHDDGGIKAINVDTQTPIEVEGGEVVITKKAVSDPAKRVFMGKKMTNKEILSYINQSGGGVALAKGGQIYGEGGIVLGELDLDDELKSNLDSVKELSDSIQKTYLERAKNDDFNEDVVINLLKSRLGRIKIELSVISKSIDTELYNSLVQEFKNVSATLYKYQIAKRTDYYTLIEHFLYAINTKGNALNISNNKTVQGSFDSENPKKIASPYNEIIYSENFKEWFGDWELAKATNNYNGVSKAIDENGFPEIYFHGGRQYQTTYRPISQVSVFYWAKDFRYAKWFAENAFASGDEDSVILRAYVSCKNPIDLTPFGHRPCDLGDLVRYVITFYPQTNLRQFLPENLKKLLRENAKFNITVRAWQLIRQFNSWVTYVRDQNIFDGFMYAENNPSQIINGEEHTTPAFAVFDSNQIKFPNQIFFNGFLDDFRFEEGGILI